MSCGQTELVASYVIGALPVDEARPLELHLAGCATCRREHELLRPVLPSLAGWPTAVLRPATDLWDRIAARIGDGRAVPTASAGWREPAWEDVAPGISCKLLATDTVRNRVSMLVRLAPNTAYPAHTHAGVEELHLLDGELWIDSRKLMPGDYNRAEPGTGDQRVWSETGCTCVLITSPGDVLA